MNWFIRTLAGAFVAGIGWKLGHELYESVKKVVQKQDEAGLEEDPQAADAGEGGGPGDDPAGRN
jgi:hypothetical protein